jgi:hypothetical protein
LSTKKCRLPNCCREKLSPAQKCRQHKNVAQIPTYLLQAYFWG